MSAHPGDQGHGIPQGPGVPPTPDAHSWAPPVPQQPVSGVEWLTPEQHWQAQGQPHPGAPQFAYMPPNAYTPPNSYGQPAEFGPPLMHGQPLIDGYVHPAPPVDPAWQQVPPPDMTFRAQIWDDGEAPPVLVAPTPVRPVRDPSRTALAAVITFICMIVGLWAILAYMHSMAVTLSSVDSSNRKVILQLKEANAGLIQLDLKTRNVAIMSDNAKKLGTLMVGIDADMASMLVGVGSIGREMTAMNHSLAQLDSEITQVEASNLSVAAKLGGISTGLKGQASKVQGMRKDVQATSRVLKKSPVLLRQTNGRLIFVNKIVCYMGRVGLGQDMKATFKLVGALPLGSVDIKATMIPPGGWTC